MKGPENRADTQAVTETLDQSVQKRNQRAGRLAKIGLAGAVFFGAGAATELAANDKGIQGDVNDILSSLRNDPVVTMEVEGVPKNEDILFDPETRSFFEKYVKVGQFTEINPSADLYGETSQIATWGMKYPEVPGDPAVMYYTETLSLREFPAFMPANDKKSVLREIADDATHYLPLGESRVITYKDGPRSESYGYVIVPSKDVKVYVRTWGNVPAEYELIPSEAVEGSPFDGYYLSFNSYARVSNEANAQGITSVDGTPIYETEEEEHWKGSYYFTDKNLYPTINPMVIVLPSKPQDSVSE